MASSKTELRTGFDFEFAPIRPLDDFLLEGARYQLPDHKNLPKWNNRILANLLYYQTNYFVILFAVFFLVGIIHPSEMLFGFISILTVVGGVYFGTSSSPDMLEFKRSHPVLSIVLMVVASYFVVYMLASVIVFLYGICLPLLLILVHASLRLRTLRNKVTQKLESAGLLQRSAMGKMLDVLGVDVPLVTFE